LFVVVVLAILAIATGSVLGYSDSYGSVGKDYEESND